LYNARNQAWRQFQRLTTGNIHHQKKTIPSGLTAEKTAFFGVLAADKECSAVFGLPITGMPGYTSAFPPFHLYHIPYLFLW